MATQHSVYRLLFLVFLLGGCTAVTSQSSVREKNSVAITCTVAPSSDSHDFNTDAINKNSVTLQWAPPTKNTDGSELIDLEKYRIDWGRSNGTFTDCIQFENTGQNSFVLRNIESGGYKFAMIAINKAGVKSDLSNVADRSVP